MSNQHQSKFFRHENCDIGFLKFLFFFVILHQLDQIDFCLTWGAVPCHAAACTQLSTWVSSGWSSMVKTRVAREATLHWCLSCFIVYRLSFDPRVFYPPTLANKQLIPEAGEVWRFHREEPHQNVTAQSIDVSADQCTLIMFFMSDIRNNTGTRREMSSWHFVSPESSYIKSCQHGVKTETRRNYLSTSTWVLLRSLQTNQWLDIGAKSALCVPSTLVAFTDWT